MFREEHAGDQQSHIPGETSVVEISQQPYDHMYATHSQSQQQQCSSPTINGNNNSNSANLGNPTSNNNVVATSAPSSTNCQSPKSRQSDAAPAAASSTTSSTTTTSTTATASNLAQTSSCEVTFLRDFLLFHLDLIQQQNEEIISKEAALEALQQENALLKKQISCMERGIALSATVNSNFIGQKTSEYSPESLSEDMIVDSDPAEPPAKCVSDNGQQDDSSSSSVMPTADIPPLTNNNNTEAVIKQQIVFKILHPSDINCDLDEHAQPDPASVDIISKLAATPSEEPEVAHSPASSSNCPTGNVRYTIERHSGSESGDAMKNLRMSIRRKRLGSTSSALSNNDSNVDEKEKLVYPKLRKKRKGIQMMTTTDLYVTRVGETPNFDFLRQQELAEEAAKSATLEVPHWRIKVYSDCDNADGIENLDDEVFLKRHARLENDERRRKRWDVQRIREQRHVERLKLRQLGKGGADGMGCVGACGGSDIAGGSASSFSNLSSASSSSNSSSVCTCRVSGNGAVGIVRSLWPSVDDIHELEINERIPVSAFGAPLVIVEPCEFSLPWITTEMNTSSSSSNPTNSSGGPATKRPTPTSRKSNSNSRRRSRR